MHLWRSGLAYGGVKPLSNELRLNTLNRCIYTLIFIWMDSCICRRFMSKKIRNTILVLLPVYERTSSREDLGATRALQMECLVWLNTTRGAGAAGGSTEQARLASIDLRQNAPKQVSTLVLVLWVVVFHRSGSLLNGINSFYVIYRLEKVCASLWISCIVAVLWKPGNVTLWKGTIKTYVRDPSLTVRQARAPQTQTLMYTVNIPDNSPGYQTSPFVWSCPV